jgi:hypothetical protein
VARLDLEALMSGMRERLRQDEAEGRLAGLTVEDLMDALSHPAAPDAVAEALELEAASVQAGEPAPDFSLPWLPRGGDAPTGRMTLSEHFGKRPVALIFGSYT